MIQSFKNNGQHYLRVESAENENDIIKLISSINNILEVALYEHRGEDGFDLRSV